MSLSAKNRVAGLVQAAEQEWDLIVIGGGITGAGIALDAAARGIQVLLLEKYDFAGGTSSKSTKLIHGGLRYLKQLEFGLVRTVGMERAVLHKLAPHLVQPIDMVLPIIEGGTLGKLSTALALTVYDTLAGVKKHERYRMLSADQMMAAEPLLHKQGLIAGAVYKEYRTDDARLTMAVLKSANQYGAACFNYCKVEALTQATGKINGVQCTDLIQNKSYAFKARAVVNAAGPWVDEVRTLEALPKGKTLHLTKGIHIVVPAARLPIKKAMYFDVAADDRMIFAIPREQVVYIGTTDTNYYDSKESIHINKEDVVYLLAAVNNVFPDAHLQIQDVNSAWAGLRPLIHEEGKNPSELSRKDEIFHSERGLISIAGGKLTGYRKMAEKVVRIISRKLKKETGRTFPAASTKNILLHGADFKEPLATYIEKRAGEVKQMGIAFEHMHWLVHTYGTDTEKIIDHFFECVQQFSDPLAAILHAEMQYTIEEEMVISISDFLIRRTGRAYFDMPFVQQWYPVLAADLAQQLDLDAIAAADQLAWLEGAIAELTTYPSAPAVR